MKSSIYVILLLLPLNVTSIFRNLQKNGKRVKQQKNLIKALMISILIKLVVFIKSCIIMIARLHTFLCNYNYRNKENNKNEKNVPSVSDTNDNFYECAGI
jgi:hypothetical protein